MRIEARVVALRAKYGWGANKLKVLAKEGIEVPRVTINLIIHRNGLLIEEDCSKPALKRFEQKSPNEMWQVDLKGCLGRGSARCEPLSILDDHSRFLVGLFPTRTSNRDVSEWGSVFPDPVPAGAAIDRLFDRATVVPFKGPSYRLKGKIVAPMSAEIQTFNNLE